jgi:hypothetical protein
MLSRREVMTGAACASVALQAGNAFAWSARELVLVCPQRVLSGEMVEIRYLCRLYADDAVSSVSFSTDACLDAELHYLRPASSGPFSGTFKLVVGRPQRISAFALLKGGAVLSSSLSIQAVGNSEMVSI